MKNILVLACLFLGGVLFFSSCQKEMSNETGVTQIAEGSLQDSLGNCSSDSVRGTYYTGITPGKDTAYVQIEVNVTKVGSYTITTDLENGFQFADSGFFTSTGINTVLLKPVGTPILQNTTTFSVMFDSSLCNFSVNVMDSTGTGIHSGGGDTAGGAPGDPDAGGSWQFSTPNQTFHGTLDTVLFGLDTAIWGSGDKLVSITGFTSNKRDSVMELLFNLPNGVIKPGIYTTQAKPPANAALFDFLINASDPEGGDPIYESSSAFGSSTPTNITINITSYNTSTRVITGTFSGTAEIDEDGSQTGKTINITNGSFTATVPQ